MKCPIDDTPLTMTERSGIEIDYCPQCRGVWLDRGELDKLIERSATMPAPRGYDDRGYRDDDRRYRDDDHRGWSGKRRGWLGELFD